MVITVKMEKVPSVVVFLKMKYLMSNPIAKFLRVWNLYVRIKNGSSYDFEEVSVNLLDYIRIIMRAQRRQPSGLQKRKYLTICILQCYSYENE